MEFNKKRLSIQEAKDIDLVSFLSNLGFQPAKIRNNDYWYCSPLRDETIPSFKVNRKLNRWYDHGMGKGGNLVDFALLYHRCTIGELLQNLTDDRLLQQPIYRQQLIQSTPDNHINILSDLELSSFALSRYLKQRNIPMQIAAHYCKEVRYELYGKTYYAIGFKNDSGGFELRNPYFKGSSSPKDITTMDHHADEAIVFEGFMDFLSFMAAYQNEPVKHFDFVVLNSVSFFEKARPFMESHQAVRLYLDRDAAGQNCSRHALSISSKYVDESNLYQSYKDFNDWLMNFGKHPRKYQRQRPR